MVAFTKTAVDVFAPTDESGALRKISPEDAQTWGTEVERSIANGVVGTSTTSVEIGTGEKTFTIVEPVRGWGTGARLRASSDANTGNWMEGTVVSYGDDTLVLDVDATNGTGTVADWTLNIAGEAADLSSVVLKAATDASTFGFVLDEDDFASDSATKVPTQQSVKAYVNTPGVGQYQRVIGDSTFAILSSVNKMSQRADLRDWDGLDLTGNNDCTSLLNTILADPSVISVYMPAGKVVLTDMVTKPNDKHLIGEGVTKSVFSIPAEFNMAAAGVMKLGTSENVGLLDQIGFEFEQPATGERADMNQYPSAINHNGIPRVRIGHIRISGGWNGIDAGGNAGGSKYDYIECGTLHRGLLIDGSLDTFDVGYFKVWPYGIGASGDGGTGDVYRDQTNVGAEIGRCDGLEGKLILFQAGLFLNANATAGGGTPRHLDAVHLDSDGAWFEARSGAIDIDYLYMTRTSNATKNGILLQSGEPKVRIGSIHGSSSENGASIGEIQVLTGELSINGGRVLSTGVGHRIAYVNGGSLKVRNTEFVCDGTRTQPILRADSGELIAQNCEVADDGGTGDFVLVAAAAVTGKISNNKLSGRKLNINAGSPIEMDQSYRGYVSADATATVRVPSGWTVSKVATGVYAITHNLGWTQSRQAVTVTPQNNATDASAIVDQTNTTTNLLRVRTFSAGVAADLPFSFEIAHV